MPSLTSIFLPEKRGHLLAPGTEVQKTRRPSLNPVDPMQGPSARAEASAHSMGSLNLQGRSRTRFTGSTL
ncbi:hypothetical protein AMECASPLE_006551 [Ameca splendens]|uniref:Uncharacterized protein n=1 Tax=Ameca splendens TaxID=208324 RepID=A0ABV0YAJ7_9TELE